MADRQLTKRFVRDTRLWAVVSSLLAFGLIASIVFLLSQAARHEAMARAQAEQKTEVISELRAALESALDAETGQRGFLLTGRRAYLEPYERGIAAWAAHLDRLDVLSSAPSEASRRSELALLRDLAAAKMNELADTIATARSDGAAAALAIVMSDRGQTLMEEYRAVTGKLVQAESAELLAAFGRARGAEAQNLPLMVALACLAGALVVTVFWLELRALRARALEEGHHQAILVSRELNHRVKNIFAVITSMIGLAARSGADPATALADLRERVHALSLAHGVTAGGIAEPIAPLGALVKATLSPYAGADSRIVADGEDINLPATAVTPLGLILHELATNAAKYGALAREDGCLQVAWAREGTKSGGAIKLRWRETSAVNGFEQPEKEGFGTMMMSLSAHQLHGKLERHYSPDGLETILEFPIPGAAQ